MKNRNGISTTAIRKMILSESTRFTKIRFTGQPPDDGGNVEIHGYNPKFRTWEYITEFDDIHIQDVRLCDVNYRL